MALAFNIFRLGIFLAVVGLSAVTIALSAHYHHFILQFGIDVPDPSLAGKIIWNPTAQTYAIAVGAISLIFFVPMAVVDRVRRGTTPPVFLELIIVLLNAILWVALAAKIQSIPYFWQISCSNVQVPDKSIDLGFNPRNACRQVKVLEIFSWIDFGLLMIYFLFVTAYSFREHKLGNSPWTKKVHELQEKEW